MTKKKTFLMLIIAFVLGIAVGAGLMLGLNSGSNSGTVTEGNVVASGSCGDNMTWELHKIVEGSNYLLVNGTGQMTSCPWNTDEYRGTIYIVGLSDGVTNILPNAFQGCSGLTSITMSNTLTEIGNNAFSGCTSAAFTSVWLPKTMKTISTTAFKDCSISRVSYEGEKSRFSMVKGGSSLISVYGMQVAYSCARP